jgi:tetratricopeptide (TPR) repeat protein
MRGRTGEDAGTAGRREYALPPRVSLRRILGWSLLGSAAVVLVALAARPKPMGPQVDEVDRVLDLYGRGEREKALRAAEDLKQADPSEPRVWLLAGMLEEDRRDVVAAERAYLIALDLLPANDARRTDVEVTLADLARRKGDPARALETIDKLARERGETARTRHARVLALIDLGRLDDALSESRRIAEESFGGGVARKLEKQVRSLMDAKATRDG